MRIVMMATGTFAEPTFEALLANFGAGVVGLVTQPQRDGGNKRGSTRQTGKGMAAIAPPACTIVQPESINSQEGLEQLRAMKPDLLVVAAYGQILSKDVLSVPSRGVINVHASLLPKYRGAAPVAYAILNGETQTGVTIIKVTPGLDSGDMIVQEALDIHPDDTTGSLEARLAVLGAKLAVDVVRRYALGEPITGVKQDPALVTKAPKIKKEQGLIDWSQPAEVICRHIRAMQPWPTAYTYLHRPGKEPLRVIISTAHSLGEFNAGSLPAPGRVSTRINLMAVNGGGWIEIYEGLVVWSGNGSFLAVTEIQPAGKKRMSGEEFLRGHNLVMPDVRFGPEQLA
jgi:methionyl-tRNA formyltransferase